MAYLYEIRGAVARLCNDWVEMEATAASPDTTVFFDNVNGYENDHHYRGSDVWFKYDVGTAANRGTIVRCTGSTLSTTSLDLGAGLTDAPAIGDIAWVFNIGGQGERIRTYDAVINDAIRSLGPAGEVPYTEDTTDVWDIDAPWVDIPATFTALSKLQYYDADEIWYDVPNHSFSIDTIQRKIAMSIDYTYLADGKLVRFIGKKKHPTLVDDDDETNIDFEWLTNECAGQLLMNRRDQAAMNKGGLRKNNADAVRGKASVHSLLEGSIRLT